ncbi:MAG: TRAP transporter permease, partial [Gammaproteobacteria bacterium]|nr:TRAP transporter permease [Gammaproteobacteria bacterium]
MDTDEAMAASAKAEISRYRLLPTYARVWLIAAAMLSVFASVYIIFGLGNVFGTYVPLETEYFYFMLALLLPLPFVVYPLTPRSQEHLPWYDLLLSLLAMAVAAYFCIMGNEILDDGWEYDAPQHALVLAFVLWALVLEATRRAGGNAIFVVCLLVSIYPIFANLAPGFLAGDPIPAAVTAGFHMFGTESML